MIEVTVKKDGRLLCHMTLESVRADPILRKNDEVEDYIVKVVVKRGTDMSGILTRVVEDWPKNSLNSLGLLKAALSKFDFEALGMEDDVNPDDTEASASDLARGLTGTMPAISGKEES